MLIGLAFNVPTPRVEHRLDFLGAALLVGAVTLLSFVASTAGESYSWGSPVIIVSGAFGAVLAVALFLQERRTPEPVFPLNLLSDRIVAVSAGTTFCIGAANFGMAMFLPIFLQVVQGVSATRAGLALLPISVGITLSSWAVGRNVIAHRALPLVPARGRRGLHRGRVHAQHDRTGDTVVGRVDLHIRRGRGVGHGEPRDHGRHAERGAVRAARGRVLARHVRTHDRASVRSRVRGDADGGAVRAHLDRLVDSSARASLDGRQLRTETKTIDELPQPVRSQVIQAFRLAVNDSFRLATVFCVAGLVVAAMHANAPAAVVSADR